ncbi:MAG: polyphosphate polymerase domain-containing protein, partial [Candidatus Hydrogenedentota bacterium]
IDFMAPHMRPDPMGLHYPVTSLYLDNDRLSMFWSSETREKNRYKLRLRSYDDHPNTPVYAEVKRRLDRVIKKTRVPIKRESIPLLLSGCGADQECLVETTNQAHLADLHYFCELQAQFQAMPCATVRYQREAYMSNEDALLRITFDRDLSFLPSPEYEESLWKSDAFWHHLHQVPVVMEVKFTDTYPHWVTLLIQRFNLERTSLAKYVECVRTMQQEQHILHNPRELLI